MNPRCNVCGRPGPYYLESPKRTGTFQMGVLLQNLCLEHLKRFVGFVL